MAPIPQEHLFAKFNSVVQEQRDQDQRIVINQFCSGIKILSFNGCMCKRKSSSCSHTSDENGEHIRDAFERSPRKNKISPYHCLRNPRLNASPCYGALDIYSTFSSDVCGRPVLFRLHYATIFSEYLCHT